jgi:hypothetical protein
VDSGSWGGATGPVGGGHAGSDVGPDLVRAGAAAGEALDRDAFETFVTEALVPFMRSGDVVVLDNLSVLKSVRSQQAIGARLVLLPSSSPDFNPIELALGKLEHGWRAAGVRTTETVMAATRNIYPRITATDARGFDRHAGYFL